MGHSAHWPRAILALMRIEEKLDELLGAALVHVRREVRALIELLQAKLDQLESR